MKIYGIVWRGKDENKWRESASIFPAKEVRDAALLVASSRHEWLLHAPFECELPDIPEQS